MLWIIALILEPVAIQIRAYRCEMAAIAAEFSFLRTKYMALCWAHARRQFFELADIAANARRGKNAAAISPVLLEAVTTPRG